MCFKRVIILELLIKDLWLSQQFNHAATHILQLLSKRIGVNTFFIATNDTESNVVLKAINNNYTLIEEGYSLPFKDVLCRFVCEENNPDHFVVNNLGEDIRTRQEKATQSLKGSGCFIGVPIVLRNGDVFGTLCGMDNIPYHFEDEDINLISSLGSLLSLTIEMERMTQIDDVSRLYTLSFMRNVFSKLADDNQERALLCIDIDHFKKINEVYGHHIGDQILRLFSERLQSVLGTNSIGCRYSADEFLFLYTNSDQGDLRNELNMKFQDIQKSLQDPFVINDNECYISCSLGVSVFPGDGDQLDLLIRNAHNTMNKTKKDGRNSLQFFKKSHLTDREYQLEIEQGLHKALTENQLFLEYQPQYIIKTEEIIGVEALIRWQHPKLGRISPGDFIPIAEETGMIINIGKWLLTQVCNQGNSWIRKGIPFNEISINVSIREIRQKGFIDEVQTVLKETGFDPSRLKFEITESMFIQDTDFVREILFKLKDIGISISLDDFGTGYSSLSILGTLPLQTIKVDRSFVTGFKDSETKQKIVKSIISLADSLEIDILAEGIESKEESSILSDLGCDFAQGFYYSKPVSVESIELM